MVALQDHYGKPNTLGAYTTRRDTAHSDNEKGWLAGDDATARFPALADASGYNLDQRSGAETTAEFQDPCLKSLGPVALDLTDMMARNS